MISWLFWSIINAIPLWAWIALAVVGVLVAYRLLGRLGSEVALGVAATAIAVIFGEQRGRNFQLAKDNADADKAIAKANAARAAADRRNADDARVRDPDPNERR